MRSKNPPIVRRPETAVCVSTVHVGDYGLELLFDMGVDISDGTSEALNYKKPDGTTALLDGDLSIFQDRYLLYVLADGDLDLAGVYEFQAELTLDGFIGTSLIFGLEVVPKIVVT